MSKIGNFFQETVVDKAIRDAASQDDFKISALTNLLDSERVERTYDDIAVTLGATGYTGMIYVEQDDIGNGLEDVQAPRINIEVRKGMPVDVPRAKKMGHSTLGILRRFPVDLR